MASSWKDLPTELLRSISNFLPDGRGDKTILACALVCKSWRIVVNHHLYGTVGVYSISSLLKFNRTIVENNAEIASMVKRVHLFATLHENNHEHTAQVYTLLTSLPNLEEFESRRSPCFATVKRALRGSRLNNLKILPSFQEQFTVDYVACILLMRNRLQKLLLSGRGKLFDRVYRQLDRFEQLEEISIVEVPAGSIPRIDSVVEKCLSLRSVQIQFNIEGSVRFEGERVIASRSSHPETVMDERNITPRPTIQTLRINFQNFRVHEILLSYIMRKYQKLNELHIENLKLEDNPTSKSFITYLSRIKDVKEVEFFANAKWFFDHIGSYWEATSVHRQHKLITLNIQLENDPGDSKITCFNHELFEITSPVSNFENTNFSISNGEHVGNFKISECSRNMVQRDGVTLMESFTTNLNRCANLKVVEFFNSDIFLTNASAGLRDTNLQELIFNGCKIIDNAIDTILKGIDYINILSLFNCSFVDEHDQIKSIININLPNTAIGSLIFTRDRRSQRPSKFVFFSVAVADGNPERVKKYYKHDFEMHEDGFLEVSNELEYNDERNSHFIHLQFFCQSITLLQPKQHEGIMPFSIRNFPDNF